MNDNRLAALPSPEQLKRQLQILAALDLILCEEDWLRVHQYAPNWNEQVQLGIVDNGAGDDMYLIFAPEGALIKGFDHESPFSPHARDEYEVWPAIYDDVPSALLRYIKDDEALEKDDVTFCLWQALGDSQWQIGNIERPEEWDDGFEFLIGYLNDSAEAYVEWAESYFEMKLDLDTVKQIYAGSRITAEMINKLNPARNAAEALLELKQLELEQLDL